VAAEGSLSESLALQPAEPISPAAPAVIAEILAAHARNRVARGDCDYPSVIALQPGDPTCRVYHIPSKAECRQRLDVIGGRGSIAWTDVLLERFADAVAAPDEFQRRADLVQIAAIAMEWIESIDRRLARMQPPPLRPGRG